MAAAIIAAKALGITRAHGCTVMAGATDAEAMNREAILMSISIHRGSGGINLDGFYALGSDLMLTSHSRDGLNGTPSMPLMWPGTPADSP